MRLAALPNQGSDAKPAKRIRIRNSAIVALLLSTLVNAGLIVWIAAAAKTSSREWGKEVEVETLSSDPSKPAAVPNLTRQTELQKDLIDRSEEGYSSGTSDVSDADGKKDLAADALKSIAPYKIEIPLKAGSTMSQRRSDVESIAASIKIFDAVLESSDSSGIGKGEALPAGLQIASSFRSRLDPKEREKSLRRYGGGKDSEDAVKKALDYLAKCQSEDGGWGGEESRQTGDHVALSSLATLSFLAHGEGFNSKSYGETLKKASDFLVQLAETPKIELAGKSFGHAILAYALAEAYATTGGMGLRARLEERLKFIVAHQNKFGSFAQLYDNSPQAPPAGEQANAALAKQIVVGEPACDLSLLGWHVQAMVAARNAGVNVEGLDKALDFAAESLAKIHQAKNGGFSQGINMKRFPDDDSMNGVGLLSLQLLNAGFSAPAQRARSAMESKDVKAAQPSWSSGADFPLYRWYYQTQALFQAERGAGSKWKDWNENLKKELLSKQQPDGSWSLPHGDASFRLKDAKDLSIYASSLCALTLEVYYRYLPSYSVAESAGLKERVANEADAGVARLITRLPGGPDPLAEIILGIGSSSFEPISFGSFNGQPADNSSALIPDEFSVYATMKSTVPVRKAGDWPQTLQPNQRVAIFFDELLPKNFKGSVRLLLAVVGTGKEAVENKLSLEVAMNGKRLLNSYMMRERQLFEIIVPASLFQPYGNICQVRNNGSAVLAFDAAQVGCFDKIGPPLRFGAENLETIPPSLRHCFNSSLIQADDSLKLDDIASHADAARRMGVAPMLRIAFKDEAKEDALIESLSSKVALWGVDADEGEIQKIKRRNPQAFASKTLQLSGVEENQQALPILTNGGIYSPDAEHWGFWPCHGSERMGNEFQLFYMRQTGREIVDWISGGGTGIFLRNLANGGKYFDTVFRTEYPAAAALRQAAKLFEGSPRRLPAQIYPAYGTEPLLYTNVAASLNSPGVATLVVAKRFPFPEETAILALLPWSGETEMTVEKGFLEENSPFAGAGPKIERQSKTVQVEGGVFSYSASLPELAVIRLVKKGAAPLSSAAPQERIKTEEPSFDNDSMKVQGANVAKWMYRYSVRNARSFAAVFGWQPSFQTIPATTGAEFMGDFVPAEKESLLVNFAMNGVPNRYDSVYLTLGEAPANPETLSFNVLPRLQGELAKDGATKIPLRVAFGGRCYQTALTPGRWQWVTLPLNGATPGWSCLRIVAPAKFQNAKISSVSFEINDVSVLTSKEDLSKRPKNAVKGKVAKAAPATAGARVAK